MTSRAGSLSKAAAAAGVVSMVRQCHVGVDAEHGAHDDAATSTVVRRQDLSGR